MAEEKPQEAAGASEEAAQPEKKKLPIKTAAILTVALVLEAVAISAAFMFAGGPATVHAEGAPHDEAALAEQPVELLVAADKYQNTRTGRPYLYDTEIYLVTKAKFQEDMEAKIEMMGAQISTDIATIFRRAEPAHLLEPELSTLTRQIRAALDNRLGFDEDGKPFVDEVLIKKCMQFRADP